VEVGTMAALDRNQLEALMKIVQDPRYDQQKHLSGLAPAAEFKLAVTAGGLVERVNKAYGWNLPENGNWTVEQANDIIYEIVTKDGYSLDAFLRAIKSGRRL
jgi:hypothetical protein